MKTRKLLAVVLAVAMLASFISVPVFADGHEGGILEDLGILEGTDEDGVTEEYLASTATRAQAALIHLRLFGLEEDALAFEGTETFMDAATATEFWQPVLEYLKANPELGWQGDDEGYFMPTAAITGQQFTKVLLVALGYVEGTDFTYDETMTFAAGIGLDALADMAAEDLTVEDLAVALVQALGLKTTGVEDWTLASKLVADGLIDEAAAEAAGFEITAAAFVVVSAEATGLKKVEVTMSTDIPAGTAIMLKKGTIGIVTTAVIDGAKATLTGMFNFAPGTYTVTVGEAVSAPFAIAAETAQALTIGAEYIYLTGAQDLKVKLENQYGEAMSLVGKNISVFNTNTGWVFTPSLATPTTVKITPTDDAGAEKAGDEIYVFVYDPVSQLQANATVLLKADPYLASIEYVSWTQNVGTTEKDDKLYEGDTTAQMVIKCYDQYGMTYTLTEAKITTSYTYSNKIQILSSNGDVLSAGAVTVSGGKLMFKAGVPGTAMFTFIIPDQAVVVSSPMITVYADPELTTVGDFVVVGAANANGQVVAAEANTVTAVGRDQYQTVTKFTSTDASDFTFTSTNSMVLTQSEITVGENKFTLTPLAAGNATVFVFYKNALQGSFDISVQAAAAPLYISAVAVAEAMETGVSDTVVAADVTVMDQYNRKMTAPFDSTWEFVVEAATTETHVTVTGSAMSYTLSTAGLTPGNDTFTALLTKSDVVQEESGFQFTVRNVAATEIDGLAIAALTGPMYLGPDYGIWGATEAAYHKTVTIKGTVGDLEVILLDVNSPYGVPDIVDLITSTNDNVQVSGATLIPATPLSGNKAGTTTIKVWRNGVVEDTAELAVSIAKPDLTTIVVNTATTVVAGDFTSMFTYKDQYGVVMSGATVIAQNSPDGLVTGGYTYELTDVVDADGDGAMDDTVYTVVKWDGTISATYTKLNNVS